MTRPRVFATNLLPAGVQGMCPFPWLVLVRPARKNDEALLAHEFTHSVQQREIGWCRWVWLYFVNPEFRFDMEVEAYRVQMQYRPDQVESFARALSTIYWLDLSLDEARAALLAPAAPRARGGW